VPTDGTRFRMDFMPVPQPKVGPNRLHLDLTSTSLDDQRDSVARLVELGARHINVGQRPDEGHVVLTDPEGTASKPSVKRVVMQDPEGNESCVFPPRDSVD
jgi:Glyoxalase-like domain